jgi:hypothetical protein
VRPAKAIVQRLQLDEQRIGKHRPCLDRERSQVDRNTGRRLVERGKDVRESRHLVRVAEHVHLARHLHLAALRVDDTALEAARQELLEQTIAQRGLAAAVRPMDQQ